MCIVSHCAGFGAYYSSLKRASVRVELREFDTFNIKKLQAPNLFFWQEGQRSAFRDPTTENHSG